MIIDNQAQIGLQNAIDQASDFCKTKNPEKDNEIELLEHFKIKRPIARFKLKLRLLKNYVLQRLAYQPPHPKMTITFQRMRGVNIGKNVYIGTEVQIDFLYPHLVNIEDYVSIGMKSMIFCHSNPTNSVWLKENWYPRKVLPVTIKKGSWIAPGVIILPGITIGEHSVVGAGSVVTKDVQPFTVVAGNPAKVIKKLL